LLGTVASRGRQARVWLALAGRAIAFVALLFGIFVLHSGAILVILLAAVPCALLPVFSGWGWTLCDSKQDRQLRRRSSCYTFGWFLPGDFPRHLKRLFWTERAFLPANSRAGSECGTSASYQT